MRYQSSDIAIAVAVNDPSKLAACLGSSPDVVGGHPVMTMRDYRSAATALNYALHSVEAPVVLLTHQDVYLPAGTINSLAKRLTELEEIDPAWAVVGVIGASATGTVVGLTWSTGLGKVITGGGNLPKEVESLDEMVLVIKRSAGVRFDERLPGFHLYGTDIVQIAKETGLSSYVINLPVIHHSKPVKSLGGSYRIAYKFMQRKWRHRLPLPNVVSMIRKSTAALSLHDARLRYRWLTNRQGTNTYASIDPSQIARDIGFE